MKQALFVFFLILFLNKGVCQQSGYYLPLPEKWGVEKILFPIQFDPLVPYTGNEELRFTPGWGDSKSEEYWSYDFLWFVDGSPKLNADILHRYLTQYFTGLYLTNQKTKSTASAGSFTDAQFKKVATAENDNETYEGEISTLNFLNKQQIKFNVRVHVRNFGSANKSAILFEVSPHDYVHPVWAELDSIVAGFHLKE